MKIIRKGIQCTAWKSPFEKNIGKFRFSEVTTMKQITNRSMVDRSDLVVCYVEHESGGAYQTMAYAGKSGKTVINLAAD